MKRRRQILAGSVVLPLAAWSAAALIFNGSESLEGASEARRAAIVYPDYAAAGTVIPPNIAPLNLRVKERGGKFCLRVSGRAGDPIEIFSRDGKMQIRPAKWHALLAANRGGEILTDIYAKSDSGWTHFDTIRRRVAAEEIDPYVVYRFLPPVYNKWDHLSLRQRNLTNFEERILFDNQDSQDPNGKTAENACFNCHMFANHSPDQMLLHMRPAQPYQIPAMILVQNGRAKKVDTRNGEWPAAAYPSWHPSGKLIAFSRNRLAQIFHTVGLETRDVVDKTSDLGLYNVETGLSYTIPQISRQDRLETFPFWSPDGRYLYFTSAHVFWSDLKNGALDVYDKVRYDLMRIAYDQATDRWGQLETVVSSAQFGHSISLPVVSPDGRYLMFVGHPYGSFPLFQPEADLYMIDLTQIQSPPVHFATATRITGAAPQSADPGPADTPPLAAGTAAPRRLDELNSDRADSWHCWSSNGHWLIFSSKREDGFYTRPYIAYMEPDSHFSHPFVVPQEDPEYYGRLLMTYNRPELITKPVTVTQTEITRAMNSGRPANANAPVPSDEPWRY